MLEVQALTRSFGGLVAVNDVSVSVAQGEILGIIGPNGAGKTTLFNLITGFLSPSAGRIRFQGDDITHTPTHRLVQRGLARTFQTVRFHRESTVWETVWTAQALHIEPWGWLRGQHTRHAREVARHGEIDRILTLTYLDEHRDRLASELPLGLLRRLEIARALATAPKLLLLDEPASGMNPSESVELVAAIRRIYESGLTLVIIEHDMDVVMNLAQRIVVLNFGKKIAEGAPSAIQQNLEVVEAYLGHGQVGHA
ncbi:MAG: ABC transporter ATP-binding protein [Rhodospirillales bacterium]|nr:ABC transporter ATP-binding protein [Rhodospirillales bacterium]